MSDFFDQLTEFSRRVFQSLGIEETQSPWTSGPFRSPPKGAVLHYTGGNDIDKTLRWFMDPELSGRSSAHAVAADGWPGSWRELCEDLPLIHALPAMVVQCVPPDQIAWHATWTNSSCYGIEAVNVGELRQRDGTFVSWHRKFEGAREWTKPWEHEAKDPINLFGRFWESWTAEQIQAIAMVLWEVQKLHDCTILPAWVLGHENVQGVRTLRSTTGVRLPYNTDKRDPGPGFPLDAIRKCATVPTKEKRVQHFDVLTDPRYGEVTRAGWILDWMLPPERPPDNALWAGFRETLPDFIGMPVFGALGKLCLRILGYHVSDVTTDDLTNEDLDSVWIFQRMMGLETDRRPGPKTRRAIVERLVDRGFALREGIANGR